MRLLAALAATLALVLFGQPAYAQGLTPNGQVTIGRCNASSPYALCVHEGPGGQWLGLASFNPTSHSFILNASAFPALTGDVTTTAGSLATTIGAGAVTLPKMANQGAQTFIGNGGNSAGPLTALLQPSVNIGFQAGVDRTGVSDSRAGFVSGIAQATSGATVAFVPPGLYNLSSSINLTAGQMAEYSGMKYSGSNGISQTIGAFTPDYTNHAWLTTNATANQPVQTTATSLVILPTSSTVAYQKSAAYFETRQNDPSGLYPAPSRDGVGSFSLATADGGNTTAHVFGSNIVAYWPAGTDGTGEGAEIDVENYGTATSLYTDNNYQKTGLGIVAGGTSKSTVGLRFGCTLANCWYDAITVPQNSITNYAFRLLENDNVTNAMSIDNNGGIVTNSFVTVGAALNISTSIVTAAGASQGTATALIADAVAIGTSAAGTGVLLQATNADQKIWNQSGQSILIYPPVGYSIDGGAPNAAFLLPAGAFEMFHRFSGSAFYSSHFYDPTAWLPYTPTFTPSGGTAVTAPAITGSYKVVGKTLYLHATIGVNYTAAPTSFTFTLPGSAVNATTQAPSGINTSTNAVTFIRADGGASTISVLPNFTASGQAIVVSAVLEIN